MKSYAVLRPEPGNSATAARLRALGHRVVQLPLFEVAPLGWSPPDPAGFDALLLTSANAVRHAGPGLAELEALPVLAVGAATAAAARAAGLTVAITGTADAAALIGAAQGHARLLHLSGQETTVSGDERVAQAIPVYASNPRTVTATELQTLAGTTALLHSARAAQLLGDLVDAAGIDRATIALAALSPAVAAAAGDGWARIAIAAAPTDSALIAAD